MLNSIKQLLSQKQSQWNQPQREALVDLLLMGMYVDKALSMEESDFIDQELDALDWESGISLSSYVQRATAKVRSAKDDPQAEDDLLRTIATRLDQDGAKQSALDTLKALMSSDGTVSVETSFVQKVQTLLS